MKFVKMLLNLIRICIFIIIFLPILQSIFGVNKSNNTAELICESLLPYAKGNSKVDYIP